MAAPPLCPPLPLDALLQLLVARSGPLHLISSLLLSFNLSSLICPFSYPYSHLLPLISSPPCFLSALGLGWNCCCCLYICLPGLLQYFWTWTWFLLPEPPLREGHALLKPFSRSLQCLLVLPFVSASVSLSLSRAEM